MTRINWKTGSRGMIPAITVIVLVMTAIFSSYPMSARREQSETITARIAPSDGEMPLGLKWHHIWGGANKDYGRGMCGNGSTIYVCGSKERYAGANSYNLTLVKLSTSATLGWIKTWGGPISTDTNDARGVCTDGTSIYTCGLTQSFDLGSGDMVLVKWDSNGNQLWNYTWGDASTIDSAISVWSNKTSTYLCGYKYNFSSVEYDLVLVKLGEAGNYLWNKSWGGISHEYGYSVSCDGTSVYTCGATSSYGAGRNDLLLIKWDSAGNQVWNKTWGGSGIDYGSAMWIEGTSIYTCGYTNSTGAGSYDLLLVKWNSAGDPLWSKTWGGAAYDRGTAMWGNGTSIYTCGYTNSTGTGMNDMLLVKWDSAGNQLWNTTWGFSGNDYAYGIWSDGTDVYTCGNTDAAGNVDFAMVKWSKAITSPPDVSYTFGATSNMILWTITSISTGSRTYTIFRDGISITSGTWSNLVPIYINVDGLAAGSYQYVINASDGLGHSIQDTVIVTVTEAPAATPGYPTLLLVACVLLGVVYILRRSRRAISGHQDW